MSAEPLEPFTHPLLDEERRRAPTLDVLAKARVLVRLEPALAAAVIAAAAPSALGPVAGALGKRAIGLALAMGVAGAAVGSGVTAVVMRRPVVVQQVIQAAPLALTPPAVVNEKSVSPQTLPTPAIRKPSAPKASTLAEEQQLLETARTAILNRRFSDALTSLAKHRTSFPSGQLVEEREALAIQALGLAGEADEARSRAAQFRARYPGSMFMPAVDAISEP
jgi:hypothetical protein